MFIGINVNIELCLLCLYDCILICIDIFIYWCLCKYWYLLDSGMIDYIFFFNCFIGYVILKVIEFIL